MTKYLRYALATVCFAASVGCLALWWRSGTRIDVACVPSYVLPSWVVMFESIDGDAFASLALTSPAAINSCLGASWEIHSIDRQSIGARRETIVCMKKTFGRFHSDWESATAYFPVWYAALVAALAGVGVLRVRRRFTIRSALICVSVVAALLAMVVL